MKAVIIMGLSVLMFLNGLALAEEPQLPGKMKNKEEILRECERMGLEPEEIKQQAQAIKKMTEEIKQATKKIKEESKRLLELRKQLSKFQPDPGDSFVPSSMEEAHISIGGKLYKMITVYSEHMVRSFIRTENGEVFVVKKDKSLRAPTEDEITLFRKGVGD